MEGIQKQSALEAKATQEEADQPMEDMKKPEELSKDDSSASSVAPLSKPAENPPFSGRFVDRGDGWPEDITWWKDFLILDLGKRCFEDVEFVYDRMRETDPNSKLPDWPFYLVGPRDRILNLEEYLNTGSAEKYKASHVLPDHIRSGKSDERVVSGWPVELVQQGYSLFNRAENTPELTMEELLGGKGIKDKAYLESKHFTRLLIFLDIFKKADIAPAPGTNDFISTLRTQVLLLHFYRERSIELPPGFVIIQKNHELASPRHFMSALNSSNFNALREMHLTVARVPLKEGEGNGTFFINIYNKKLHYLHDVGQVVVRNAMRDAQIWLLAEDCEERNADLHWGQQSYGKNDKLYTYRPHLGDYKHSPRGDGFPLSAYVFGQDNRRRLGLRKDTLEGAMRAYEEFKLQKKNGESKSKGLAKEEATEAQAGRDGEGPVVEAEPAKVKEDSNGPAKPETREKKKRKKKRREKTKAENSSTGSAAADEVKADGSGTSTVVENVVEGSAEAANIETAVKDSQGPDLEEDDQSQNDDKTLVDGQASEAFKSDDASPQPSSPRTIAGDEPAVQVSLSWDEEMAELDDQNAMPNGDSKSLPDDKAPTEISAATEPKVEKETTSIRPTPSNDAGAVVESRSAAAQAAATPQKSGSETECSEKESTPPSQPAMPDANTNARPAIQLSLAQLEAMSTEATGDWQDVKAKRKAKKPTNKVAAGPADPKKKDVGPQSMAPAPPSKAVSSARAPDKMKPGYVQHKAAIASSSKSSTQPKAIAGGPTASAARRNGNGKTPPQGVASSQIKGNASMAQAGQTRPMTTAAKKTAAAASPATANKATATTPANATRRLPVAARANKTPASGAPQLTAASTPNGATNRPTVSLPKQEKPRNPAAMARMGLKEFMAAELEKRAALAKEKTAMLEKEKAAIMAKEKAAELAKEKIAQKKGVTAQAEPGASQETRKATSKTSRKSTASSISTPEGTTSTATAATKPSEKQAKAASNAQTDIAPGTTNKPETPSAAEAFKASLAAAKPPEPTPVVQQSFEVASHQWPSLSDSKEPEMPKNLTETCEDPKRSILLDQSTDGKQRSFERVQPKRPVQSKQPDEPSQRPAKKKRWKVFSWSAETQNSSMKQGTSRPEPRPPALKDASTKKELNKKSGTVALKEATALKPPQIPPQPTASASKPTAQAPTLNSTAPKPTVDKEERNSSTLAFPSTKNSERLSKASASIDVSTDKSTSTQPVSFAAAAAMPVSQGNGQTRPTAESVEKGGAGKKPPTGTKATEAPTQASKSSSAASPEKADTSKSVMLAPRATAQASQSAAQKQKHVASATTVTEKQHAPSFVTEVLERSAENSVAPGVPSTHAAQAPSLARTADKNSIDKGKRRVGPGLYTVLEQDEAPSDAAPIEKLKQQAPRSAAEVQRQQPAAPTVDNAPAVQGSFSPTLAEENTIDKENENEAAGTLTVSDPTAQTTPQNVQPASSELPPVHEVVQSVPYLVVSPATNDSHEEPTADASVGKQSLGPNIPGWVETVADYHQPQQHQRHQPSVADEELPTPAIPGGKVPQHGRPGAKSDPLPERFEEPCRASSLPAAPPAAMLSQEFASPQPSSEKSSASQSSYQQFSSQKTSSQQPQGQSFQKPMPSQRIPRAYPRRNLGMPEPRMQQQQATLPRYREQPTAVAAAG